MTGPVTRAGRHARIVELIRDKAVRSQTELAELLSDDGVQVTQATLSRDLEELGAVKVSGAYLIPEDGKRPLRETSGQGPARLLRLLRELLTGVDPGPRIFWPARSTGPGWPTSSAPLPVTTPSSWWPATSPEARPWRPSSPTGPGTTPIRSKAN